MSSTMTVRQMRTRAKSHGLKGYSNMRKAELHNVLDAIRHNVGDIVERAIDGKRGVVVEIQNSTFDGIVDSSVIVQYDGEKREDATSGAHHAFVFISRPVQRKKMDRYSHWATDHRCIRGGDWNVRQGHADYCAEYGHATYTVDGEVMSWCPRCGETFEEGKTPVQLVSDLGEQAAPVDAPETAIAERDTVDQRQMVDVMTQVVDNGREDLIPVLDMIDAAQCQVPDGRDSTIPRVHGCPRCADSTNPCDQCVLVWLVALFNITGDVTLAKLPSAPEFDCV
jgi:hypothetical protein